MYVETGKPQPSSHSAAAAREQGDASGAGAAESQLEHMLQGVDIPPCPSILLEVDQELKKEAPDQRSIAALISKDVALAGHVIQIANSPAFSFGREIRSLQDALQLLGHRHIFNLVVLQLLKVALQDNSNFSMERFWESSAKIAMLTSQLARRLECGRADVAYTFGLFRDCGIPLMVKRFPEAKRVLARANQEKDLLFTEVEDRDLGTNHAAVGYFLARRWRLSSEVVEAIRWHHDYSALDVCAHVPYESRVLIALGVLAEHVIRLHLTGEPEEEWAKAAVPVCDLLNLSLGGVDDLVEDMRELV